MRTHIQVDQKRLVLTAETATDGLKVQRLAEAAEGFGCKPDWLEDPRCGHVVVGFPLAHDLACGRASTDAAES